MSEHVPKVSLGLPVYNGEKVLPRALDSILAQTFTDFELIITDNASTDGTEALCQAYAARDPRIRYHRNPQNLGAMPNFNRAFELSRGPYFKWCSYDDAIEPEFLSECVSVLDREPRTVLCFARRKLITEEGQLIPSASREESYHRISLRRIMRLRGRIAPLLVHGLVRADALRSTRLLGSYFGSDNVLIAELRLLGEFAEVPRVLFLESFRGYVPKDRASARRWQTWVDARNKGFSLPPALKLPLEYCRAVARAPLPLWKRLGLLVTSVYVAAAFAARWTFYLALAPGRRLVSRSWIAAARDLPHSMTRARCLALLCAIRRLDPGYLRMALQRSPAGSSQLAALIANRLGQSMDAAAAELLSSWMMAGSSEMRAAAAAVLRAPPKPFYFNLRRRFGVEHCENLARLAGMQTPGADVPIPSSALAGNVP